MILSQLADTITAADKTLSVMPGEGTKFPQNQEFHLLIEDEIIYVYSIATDTMTVSRGHDGTKAAAHLVNDDVGLYITDKHVHKLTQYVDTITPGTGDFKADGSVPLTGDIDFAGSYQCHDLAAPAANGEAIRATATITEAAVDDAIDKAHSNATDHAAGSDSATMIQAVEDAGLVLSSGKNIELMKVLTGDGTWSGLTFLGTAGEALAIGENVYRNANGKMYKADAADVAKMPVLAMSTATIAQDGTGAFLAYGFMRRDAWTWTEHGVRIYVSATTPGAMTESAPTGANKHIQEVAVIIDSVIGGGSSDIIFFNPSLLTLMDTPADAMLNCAPTVNWAYDHSVLATAHGLVAATDPGGAALLHIMAVVNGASAWSVVDIFDATAPVNQAIADSAAAGTATTAAHRDHKHGMPSQATMDTASVAAVAAAGVVFATAKSVEFEAVPATHTADGVIVTMTAGAALVFGDACYVGTDGKMEKALADDAAITIPATHLCIATISENSDGLFLVYGWATDASWSFDVGKSVYLSAATAGLITKTMPTKVTGNQVQVLGTCLVADTIKWEPSMIVMEYA
jgi:hypothetical protein